MTSILRDENAECHNNSIAASYWLLQKGFLHWKTCFRSIFKAACRSFFVLPTYVKLHLEPRYNSCTLRCKHQRSVINKHEAHTIMLTTKNTPIVCTYGSARLHLKAKFEKKYVVFELDHFTRQMVSIYAIINSWLPAFLFTFTYFCSHLCCMAPNAFIAFDIRLNIRP